MNIRSNVHYGELGDFLPICHRVPAWAKITLDWRIVTCEWCLRLKPSEQGATLKEKP